MSESYVARGYKVKKTHFPITIFVVTLLTFLLMSGLHTGLILLVSTLTMSPVLRTSIIIGYWLLLSLGFTLFTRWQIRRTYETPMKQLAEATSKVANGDFSVYVPPFHTADQLDYLDVMIMDFNKMVEELGSIETLKTDFFSSVSHEIKTPIAVIQNAAELLKSSKLPEKEFEDYINSIIYSSQRLSVLITNILKLNKLENQNVQPNSEVYDLSEQLCECVLQFENVWEREQIEFEVDIEDEVMIEADRSLLELVWTNLLSNALKFTPPKGSIELIQQSTAHEVIVCIRDTGCGMSTETMNHIFDKFYQGDTSHAMRGNGLGLSIALRTLQLMGGRIEVESELHKGSQFSVYLPRKEVRKEIW